MALSILVRIVIRIILEFLISPASSTELRSPLALVWFAAGWASKSSCQINCQPDDKAVESGSLLASRRCCLSTGAFSFVLSALLALYPISAEIGRSWTEEYRLQDMISKETLTISIVGHLREVSKTSINGDRGPLKVDAGPFRARKYKFTTYGARTTRAINVLVDR
jgi:hypothetical protein